VTKLQLQEEGERREVEGKVQRQGRKREEMEPATAAQTRLSRLP
jgi:hypothetical protein